MDRAAIRIAYGRGELPLRLPNGAEPNVIRKAALPKLKDPAGAIGRAFASPIGSVPLAELARGRASACILICDITRPVPNRLFLRPMIATLAKAGIPMDKIGVLVATGLHRPNEGKELAELVGDPWVLSNVRVANHFARNAGDHVDLGRTAARGTPVSIDRRFVEADLKIATGLVEPHFMAGWPAAARLWHLASRATRRSAPSIPPVSWRIRWRSSATSSAILFTRSSLRLCGCLAPFMR